MTETVWKKCGHPRTPENTNGVCASKLGGQCWTCLRHYRESPRERERVALASAQRVVSGAHREYNAKRIASGRHALWQRESYAARKAYDLILFSEAPEKRVYAHAQTIVVLSDLQIPFEDGVALDQALQVLHSVRPDMVVLNGDIVDCYAESAFLKSAVLADASIPETHQRVRKLLECLSAPQVIWMGGNHEERWRKVLWSNTPTGLYLLKKHQAASGREIDLVDPVRSFARLFHMDEYGVTYYPYSHRLYVAEGNLVITHGRYVSRHSGYSAKRTFEWLGRSCIIGHTHRQGTYRITQDGVERGAWENGCLCQLEPEYADAPNWQQGFSIVKINGPEFHVVQVPIVRRDGKPVAIYSGGEWDRQVEKEVA